MFEVCLLIALLFNAVSIVFAYTYGVRVLPENNPLRVRRRREMGAFKIFFSDFLHMFYIGFLLLVVCFKRLMSISI